MKNNKILYIGGFELPDKNAAAHRVLNNAKALKKLGHEIDFIGVTKKNAYIDKKNIYGFPYYEVDYPKNLMQWVVFIASIKNVKKIIKRTGKQYDTIICYNFPAVAMYKLYLYCKTNKIKLIADTTEWYTPDKKNIHGLIKYIDTEIRMRYITKKCFGIICISQFLFDYYNSSENVILIPPLVDKSEEKWLLKNSNSEQQLDKKINLVYAGSPGMKKDKLNWIIDLFNNMKDGEKKAELLIIGVNRKELNNIYPQYISIDLEKKGIYLMGRIEHSEVLPIIKKADFYIFLREVNRVNMAGFPTKYVEAMSLGTPVITNKTSDLQTYMDNGVNGFFINTDDKLDQDEFDSILNMSASDLLDMKKNFKDQNIFDYNNYIEEFSKLFLE